MGGKWIFAFFLISFIALMELAFGHLSTKIYRDEARKLDLSTEGTNWDFFDSEDATKLLFIARSPHIITDSNGQKTQPTLTLRIDKTEASSAKEYSYRWLKEYPKFGYDLQNSQEAKYGELSGFEMELKSTVTPRLVKQFIVNHKSEVWVFTCSGEAKTFADTSKACEKILRTAKLLK